MNYRWLARRIASAVVSAFLVIIISWVLIEYSPNSPANFIEQMIPVQDYATNPKMYIELEQYLLTLRPHGNPVINALHYIWNVMHGNLGVSIITYVPVSTLIAEYLPWTLFIVTTSIIISFFLGIRFGQKMAYFRGTKKDSASTIGLSILRAIPIYIYAAVFLFFLGFLYKVFPTSGAYSPNVTPGFNIPFITSVLYHAFLPILTLVLVNFAGWALHMRANTISVLGEDFVTFAQASGVKQDLIEKKYIGKNALLPLYTSLIISLGFSFGGSVFIEQTFTYPGVGYMLLNAINDNDYPTEMGMFIIIIVAVILGNLIADLTYALIDPRVKVE